MFRCLSILINLEWESSSETRAAHFGVSQDGLLVFAPGSVYPEPNLKLVWRDREGNEEPLEIEPRSWVSCRLSADGKQILLTTIGSTNAVWLYDRDRRALSRQTFEGGSAWAIWGPGLGEFTFDCALGESQGIYVKSLDSGPGLGERLQTAFNGYHKHSFGTEGGLSLAFVNYSGQESLHDIWLLGCQGDREPLLRTRFRERFPELSPDGHLFAYTSTQSGRDEVYVSRFSEPGRSKQVSISGGYEPCWSRDGREIFYRLRTSDGLINYYAVSVTSTEADFQVGIPEKLFSGLYEGASPVRSYDVGPDGRFLLISFDPDQPIEILKTIAPTRIELVQNWFEELREKVPTE